MLRKTNEVRSHHTEKKVGLNKTSQTNWYGVHNQCLNIKIVNAPKLTVIHTLLFENTILTKSLSGLFQLKTDYKQCLLNLI